MKKFSLILSVLLTLVVFSFSFTSGNDSGTLSLGVSNFILEIITALFPNNHIVLTDLHIFIRKSAHIFEYLILGVTWFFTAKLWNMSYLRVLIIGVLVATADETIQIYAIDRGPSVFDALVFDLIPFTLSSLALLLIHNRKGKTKMATNTLLRLQDNTISPKEAYKELYKKNRMPISFTNRAHFVKLRIVVPEDKKATRLLRILFFMPIPIFFLKIIMKFIKEDKIDDNMPLSKKEMLDIISSKGINVQVKSNSGERVFIKTI